MEDDRSGIIPEITDSYKYEEKILMGSADARDAYLADRQLIRTGILFKLYWPSINLVGKSFELFQPKNVNLFKFKTKQK